MASPRSRTRCHRPPFSPVLYQRWSDLLFVHWRLEPGEVQERLPPGLTVETYDSSAWVGVVPFCLGSARLRAMPAIPGFDRMLELNLRTYVRSSGGQSGVFFFSLEANHALMRQAGRRVYHLNYRAARMTLERHGPHELEFRSRRPGQKTPPVVLRFRRDPSRVQLARPGSLDAFLVERYQLLAVRQRDAAVFGGRIHHQPYRLMPADVRADGRELFALNDFPIPDWPPAHAVAALPVKVATDRPRHLS